MNTLKLHQLQNLICDHKYTQEIVYRPLCRSDAFFLYQAASSTPEFNRYLLWNTPNNLADVLIQIDKLLRQTQLDQSYSFSLTDRATGSWLGFTVLKPYRDGIEMSSYIHPQYWNKGIVVTSSKGLVQCIFDHQDAPLYSRTLAENAPMVHIYNAYGFVLDAPDVAYHATKGKYDLLVFRLDKEVWPGYDGVFSF